MESAATTRTRPSVSLARRPPDRRVCRSGTHQLEDPAGLTRADVEQLSDQRHHLRFAHTKHPGGKARQTVVTTRSVVTRSRPRADPAEPPPTPQGTASLACGALDPRDPATPPVGTTRAAAGRRPDVGPKPPQRLSDARTDNQQASCTQPTSRSGPTSSPTWTSPPHQRQRVHHSAATRTGTARRSVPRRRSSATPCGAAGPGSGRVTRPVAR